MSVYLDHVYIKPTIKAYKELLNTFKGIVGEGLFQYGESREDGQKWGGFYLYFDNGSFLEVLDPSLCIDSQSVGICLTCEKEYRGQFLEQIEDSLKDQNFETKALPSEDPQFSICRLNPGKYITTWGVEYSDEWFEDWGTRSSQFGLLYPLESFKSLKFTYPAQQKQHVSENLQWIDPRAAVGKIDLPLKANGSTSLAFEEGEQAHCEMSFSFDRHEIEEFNITGEGYSISAKDGVLSLVTALEM